MTVSRRRFVGSGLAAAAGGGALLRSRPMFGSALGLPLGLQLYSVRAMLPDDYEGTLRHLAALGYREVEAAGFYQHSAAEVKTIMAKVGLRCVSAHYPWATLSQDLSRIIAFHRELGTEYIVCSSPGHKDPTATSPGHDMPLTIDDWRWNAEQFSSAGKQVKAAGLRFGYHNHVAEFRALDGVVPYDELLRLTDPSLVTFEMDCGWVTVGGGDPTAYLRNFSNRISMLHVKDFKSKPGSGDTKPVSAELGQGVTDWKALFAAVRPGQIKHCFVEQEEFDMPPFDALKVDAEFMKGLH